LVDPLIAFVKVNVIPLYNGTVVISGVGTVVISGVGTVVDSGVGTVVDSGVGTVVDSGVGTVVDRELLPLTCELLLTVEIGKFIGEDWLVLSKSNVEVWFDNISKFSWVDTGE